MSTTLQVTRAVGNESIALQTEFDPSKEDAQQVFAKLMSQLDTMQQSAEARKRIEETKKRLESRRGRLKVPKLKKS
jgi:hypothetical protein